MSLVPSCQLNPVYFKESLHGSLFKFHGVPQLQFFRYDSSFLCSTRKRICSESIDRRNPPKGSNFGRGNDGELPRSSSDSSKTPSSSSGRWLDKWNRPRRQQISPKPPKLAVNYRVHGGSGMSSWGGRRTGPSNDTDFGGGGSSTMDKIVEKLKRFGYMEDEGEKEEKYERRIEKGSVEDIFYVEDGILPNTRGGFSEDSPLGVERPFGGDGEARFPWEKPPALEEEVKYSVRKLSRTSMAELTLPEPELRRLRHLAVKTKEKMKIGGGGVTQAVVESIRDKWKGSEVVRLKVEGASALNMKRMHEILERKTNGMVIWRSGTSVFLYRGVSYNDPSEHWQKQTFKKNTYLQDRHSTRTDVSIQDQSKLDSYSTVRPLEENPKGNNNDNLDSEFSTEVRYEDEIDKLLADLGPRYSDWPGGDPLPVDADMLPSGVPGYKPPFRLLPYGVRATISVNEATALRRIARTLPPHFALGRNRQLQGLATAMVKLWERSSIAKVALKRGVQVTTSERMAEEIKRLTGGMLLSRNKDFLVFYRGKNFLSPDVAEALLERERLAVTLQDEEEQARLRSSALVSPSVVETVQQPVAAGTLKDTMNADARWGKRLDDRDKKNALREAEMLRHASLVKKLERKLYLAEKKLMKGEYALAKVEQFLNPSKREADPDSITDEERFMYRKLGLRMKAFLLLGRRGVFDGTIENMHLHWKYRELVKIIVKVKTFQEVQRIALSLEAESGGILVSVDKVSKGYAVIVFRGKDYSRPSTLRPKNLLTKRKALARSIELQRREALLKHLSTMQRNVGKLRSEIDQMGIMAGKGDKEFYDTIESSYPSEDEDTEEEGDDAYLTTYMSDNEHEEETSSSFIQTLNSKRNGGDSYKGEGLETEIEEEGKPDYIGSDSEDVDGNSVHFPWDDQEPEVAENTRSDR
ncbi:hypothetical protein V2J09_011468 [Rumex salicifolius]